MKYKRLSTTYNTVSCGSGKYLTWCIAVVVLVLVCVSPTHSPHLYHSTISSRGVRTTTAAQWASTKGTVQSFGIYYCRFWMLVHVSYCSMLLLMMMLMASCSCTVRRASLLSCFALSVYYCTPPEIEIWFDRLLFPFCRVVPVTFVTHFDLEVPFHLHSNESNGLSVQYVPCRRSDCWLMQWIPTMVLQF